MYNWNVTYVTECDWVMKGEFESPSPYLDLATLSRMQIFVDTISKGGAGIINVGVVNENLYKLPEERKTEKTDEIWYDNCLATPSFSNLAKHP